MGLTIQQIEYYLPKLSISNDDLAKENPDWDFDKIKGKTGVFSRHIAGVNETSLDLAINAVEKVFIKDNSIKGKIDSILYCTQSPDYIMPSNSFLIHKHFGFNQNVWTFDYNLACSGFVYGLAIANGILKTGLAKNIMLITSETYSKYIDPKDRSTRTLFGDGAAVSILSEFDRQGILDIVLASDGHKFDTFYIPEGGCRLPVRFKKSGMLIDDNEEVLSSEYIHMDGFAVWQFISKNVSDQVVNILNRNNLNVNDIDLFIFHQASKLTLDSLMKMLKIKEDKVYINLSEKGNTVSASIPIALKDAYDEGKLKRGDLILISGFGVGLSWGSIIMRY